MKNPILIIIFIFAASLCSAQTVDSLKLKLSKEWTINGYEQFGVVDEPKEAQSNDKVAFNADNTCLIIENGTKYTGKWSIDNTKST